MKLTIPEAAIAAATPVALAAIVGSRDGPTPNHPRTAAWYARLEKPAYTPPGPVFGAAWAALDGLVWFSGYRLLRSAPSPRRTVALGLWASLVTGIGGFSHVLFGKKRLGPAFAVSGGMFATSLALVGTAAGVDRKAAAATVPLVAWLAFASLLQEEVWRRNTG